MPIQKKSKPVIEDVIPEYLEGDMKEAAQNFVAWLRANKMQPVWASANIWKASYKGGAICAVQRPISVYSQYKSSWVISPHLNYINKYEEEVVNEGLQDTFWDCIVYCDHSGDRSGKGCSPNKPCAGGKSIMRLGKEISGVCSSGCNAAYAFTRICDPGETAINDIKRLLLMEQKAREEKSSEEVLGQDDLKIPWSPVDKFIFDYLITRPKIEDAAGKILEGEKLQNLLDFAAWLRSNEMPPIWVHWCRWRIKPICDIDVSYGAGIWHWNINFNPWIFYEDDLPLDERSKKIAWAHVRLCKNCGGCGPGGRLMLLGKEFERVCHQTLTFWNPGTEEIECMKQLILTKRNL
jgi:hypothetical protein